MTTPAAPPGWYPDPTDPSQQRYWDGAAWGQAAPRYAQQVGYGYAQGVAGAAAAGFWIRFAAAFIDGLITSVPFSILGLLVNDPDGSGTVNFGIWIGWNANNPSWLNVVSTVVGLLYFGFLEGGATGQTIGKRVCSIRVVDFGTFQPGIGTGRGIGRYFARWLSAIPCGLGYFWMLWDPDKQTWHDKIVRTRVVKA